MHVIDRTIIIKTSLPKAWAFFSDPRNLAFITPPEMGFVIRTPLKPGEFYPGMIIEYAVKPVAGIPMRWVSEISQVVDQRCFKDEQLKGPYKRWSHLHEFREVKDGVEVHDRVEYELPLGMLGELAHKIFVRKKLNHIFDFREKRIQFLFGQRAFQESLGKAKTEFINLN